MIIDIDQSWDRDLYLILCPGQAKMKFKMLRNFKLQLGIDQLVLFSCSLDYNEKSRLWSPIMISYIDGNHWYGIINPDVWINLYQSCYSHTYSTFQCSTLPSQYNRQIQPGVLGFPHVSGSYSCYSFEGGVQQLLKHNQRKAVMKRREPWINTVF